MNQTALPAQAALLKLLIEFLDFGEEGAATPRERLLCEACRLMEADLLYKVTPDAGGWIKTAFSPDREMGSQTQTHASGIVRHVLSKRTRFLESHLPARGPFHRHRDGWPGIEVSSYLAVPIHRRGRMRGVLVLLRTAGRPSFAVEDLTRADLLADALAVAEDLGERFSELERLARTDGITHLPNQRHLREVLGRAILRAGESDQALSLVMVDVDLKDLADIRGPLAFSEALSRIARILERNLRGTDLVAHHGGSTFVIVLPETGREGMASVVDRLGRSLQREVAAASLPSTIRCRWGAVSYPEDGADPSSLLARACASLRPMPVPSEPEQLQETAAADPPSDERAA